MFSLPLHPEAVRGPRRRVGQAAFALSPGLLTICALAVGSTLAVTLWRAPHGEGATFWTFARNHFVMDVPVVERWNHDGGQPRFQARLLSMDALERRVLSGFTAGTPVAEVIECSQGLAARTFAGPLEDVGFVDLTDLVRRDGLREQINAPSFTPWTSRGRVFGLPHDVHPVLLGYRADLVDAAGIDLSGVETWDDYFRAMRPLLRRDAAGRPDRLLLSIDETRDDLIFALILQAGGCLFDEREQPAIASATNSRVLATVISWCAGPDPVAAAADDFSAGGNQLKLSGYVTGFLLPDWLAGTTERDLPGLAGKLRLMPLPAWERGGRRTSVLGGAMLGLSRAGGPVEPRWAFAKSLYLSHELAHELYRTNGIVSPIKAFWNDPIYDEPDPYFCGQPKGRLYLTQAPATPARSASPYQDFALSKLSEAAGRLRAWAQDHGRFGAAELTPEAARLLGEAEAAVRRQMSRNVFLRVEGAAR